MFGEIRENKKARTFQYEHRILGGVFARCTHRENKKARTLKVRADIYSLVTSAGLEPATF